jgi:hypothetical protein
MTQIVKLKMAKGTVIKRGAQYEPKQHTHRVGRHPFSRAGSFNRGRKPVHVGIPAQGTGATSVKKSDERTVKAGSVAAARAAINGAAGKAFKKSSVGSAFSGAAVLAFSYHLRFGAARIHLHWNDRANED